MRSSRMMILVVFASLFSFCAVSQNFRAAASAGQDKQKGISYAAWWPGLYSLPDSDTSLAHLAETGADWISLIVTCYQDTLSSTTIYATEGTPTDEDLIHVIGQAHALGLKVMLKPHLDLWRDPSHWRGQIGPAFTSEDQWSEWFASYRAFIEHYADLAAAQRADQFCVGTELLGTSERASDWRQIIAGIRARFSGPLVYAANHSGEEVGITWWDAVDIIGVDAYYPLANKNDPTVDDLKAAWRPHVATLAGLAAQWQKPLILTEIGYRSLDGAASHPWDWQISGAVDLGEQADCYQAVLESVYGQPWFGGIFWWSWGPDPFEGGPYDTGYSPHDKPAEDLLRSWFGGAARRVVDREPESSEDRTMDIYEDGLAPGWEDRSWDAARRLAAEDYARGGTSSVRVQLGAWGALSFWHPPFNSHPYYRLEFYIRSASGSLPDLWIYFHDGDGKALLRTPLKDPRYVGEGTVETEAWSFVSIPLFNIGAARKSLSRLSFQDRSGRGTEEFWIDNLRLAGAKWRSEREKSKGKAVSVNKSISPRRED